MGMFYVYVMINLSIMCLREEGGMSYYSFMRPIQFLDSLFIFCSYLTYYIMYVYACVILWHKSLCRYQASTPPGFIGLSVHVHSSMVDKGR